jgi:hypothetical protein
MSDYNWHYLAIVKNMNKLIQLIWNEFKLI